jgi:speckle-type POZ protein
MPVQLRPPRNTICGACYEGARSLISFINKLEAAQGIDKANLCKASSINFIFLFIFKVYYIITSKKK